MSGTYWTRRVVAKLVADYLSKLSPPTTGHEGTEGTRKFADVCKLLKLTDEEARELGVAVEIEASNREKLANLPACWFDVRKALEK